MKVKELILDAYNCNSNLNDGTSLLKVVVQAANKVGATIAEEVIHRFKPYGLSVCLILKESHIIISTWPEYSFAVINIFLCNDTMDPQQSWKVIEKYLKPERVTRHEVYHEIGVFKQAA